ncbi:hypothetical protein [Bradyrhizobium sp. RDM4]|uniref:hypothetical protein n=1 Tax=Bradyrhizobium sp. RDM4 TaxID=3378765 RepID=UPI0038FC0476
MCQRPAPDRADLGELARMLHASEALPQVTNMQLRAALELAEQRGWRITKESARA